MTDTVTLTHLADAIAAQAVYTYLDTLMNPMASADEVPRVVLAELPIGAILRRAWDPRTGMVGAISCLAAHVDVGT